mgnify:CR=1 FL=1
MVEFMSFIISKRKGFCSGQVICPRGGKDFEFFHLSPVARPSLRIHSMQSKLRLRRQRLVSSFWRAFLVHCTNFVRKPTELLRIYEWGVSIMLPLSESFFKFRTYFRVLWAFFRIPKLVGMGSQIIKLKSRGLRRMSRRPNGFCIILFLRPLSVGSVKVDTVHVDTLGGARVATESEIDDAAIIAIAQLVSFLTDSNG